MISDGYLRTKSLDIYGFFGFRRMLTNNPVAETEGFEPSVREYPVRRFSKPLVSATHPRLRARLRKRGYSGAIPKLQPDGMTSNRIVMLMTSPAFRTRIPSSRHCSSGALSAALAW